MHSDRYIYIYIKDKKIKDTDKWIDKEGDIIKRQKNCFSK